VTLKAGKEIFGRTAVLGVVIHERSCAARSTTWFSGQCYEGPDNCRQWEHRPTWVAKPTRRRHAEDFDKSCGYLHG